MRKLPRYDLIKRIEGDKPEEQFNRVQKYLNEHPVCVEKCPIYLTCPFQHLAEKKPDKKCEMIVVTPKIRRRFVNLFIAGEEGMFDEMQRAIYYYAMRSDLTENLKVLKEYIELLFKLHRSKYGEKQVTAQDLQQLNVIINAKEARHDHKIIDIHPAPDTPVVEKTDDLAVDKESLLHTPVSLLIPQRIRDERNARSEADIDTSK